MDDNYNWSFTYQLFSAMFMDVTKHSAQKYTHLELPHLILNMHK